MIDGRRDRSEVDEQDVELSRHYAGIDLGGRLSRAGISANVVTIVGALLFVLAGVVIALGYLYVGIACITVGGLMDTLDGIVAKASGSSSIRGAFFDSVADRVSDALVFSGLAWYLAGRPDPRLALIPVAILGVSAVISYERAKAESLGIKAAGGFMERAERLIGLSLALLFHVVLIPMLLVLLGLCTLTAIGRFVRIWRAAGGEVRVSETRRVFGVGRVESRWRTWRETGRTGAATRRPRSRRQKRPIGKRLGVMFGASSTVTRPRKASNKMRTAHAIRRRISEPSKPRS